MRKTALCAVLAASSFVVAGCKGSDSGKHSDPAAAASTDQVRITEGGIVVKTDAGTFAVGGDTKVPDDFPAAVPVYPGATPALAGKTMSGGKASWSLTLETPDDGAKVVAFYKAKLAAFTLASDLAVGDSNMSAWQSPQYEVSLMVAAVPGDKPTTSILLSVSTK